LSDRLANFLHLGPSKSGSTWLHEALITHPQMYFTEAKDLYFFSRYYERGAAWYHAQFRGARAEHKVIGEVCPEYLSCPEAAERIRDCLGPDVRLMVTLREPTSRAFSAYLYLRKHGLASTTFRQSTQTALDLLEEGRYGTHLSRYLKYFDRRSLHVALFDDFQADPPAFVDDVTDWLGVARHAVAPEQLQVRLPASRARALPVAKLAKRGADWMRHHDRADLVGRIKRSPLVQRALYQPLGEARPEMSPEDVSFVREQLDEEIRAVEDEFGIPLRQRWGWK
jgi:Sulfotransferase domain